MSGGQYVLVAGWQPIGGGLEARLISWGDQRVNLEGRPIDRAPLGPDGKFDLTGQRFVPGARIEVREAP